MTIERTPEARASLLDIFDHIDRENPSAADRFLDAAEKTLHIINVNPLIGAPCSFRSAELAGVRRFPAVGFRRFLVFYKPTGRGVLVIRVLHGARDIPAALSE